MQLELVVDGASYTLDVDPSAKTVRFRGQTYPYRVLAADTEPVELEIAGERMLVDGWPPHNAAPIGRVTVNGEVVRLEKLLRSAASDAPAPPVSPATAPPPPTVTASATGAGHAVRPPMPGKILEVRVKDGDTVTVGQLLIVLEAMKMRNEVVSPKAGTITGLAVAPGTSVKAADVLLRITES